MIEEVASVVTAAGVCLAIIGLLQVRLERRREFEQEFVERYWFLMSQLSYRALLGQETSNEADQKTVVQYLILCGDETELRREGMISKTTWRIWKDAMLKALKRPPFAAVWDEVSKTSDDFSFLKQLVVSEKTGDDFPRVSWRAWIGR